MSPEQKRRRSNLGGAVGFFTFGLFQALLARHAQINHTVLNVKGSWYTPEVGYIVAFCFFAMAAVLLVSAFRRSDDHKR
jgi:hypothetical protein